MGEQPLALPHEAGRVVKTSMRGRYVSNSQGESRVSVKADRGPTPLCGLIVGATVLALVCALLGWSARAGASTLPLDSDPFTPPLPVEGGASGAYVSSPPSAAAVRRSRTRYEDLPPTADAALARSVFPSLIVQVGGPSALASLGRVTAYPTPFSATLALPHDKHAVVDSLFPLTVRGHDGARVPVDLGLAGHGGAFWPQSPAVPVRIPRSLGEGVSLTSAGLSLVPLGGPGAPSRDVVGTSDGASVFYASVMRDSDAVAKPTTDGFELDLILRSERSPRRLYFRVDAPAGSSLRQSHAGGAVDVLRGRTVIAVVLPPVAEDARGAAVPVSMSLVHGAIELAVHESGSSLFPISVDPTVIDPHLEVGRNWEFQSTNESMFRMASGAKGPEIEDILGNVTPPNHANFNYYTQGESHIYKVSVTETITEPTSPPAIDDVLAIRAKGGKTEESKEVQTGSPEVCANGFFCEPKSVTSENRENRAFFEQQAVRTPGIGGTGRATLESASVGILQEASPRVSFNQSATLNGRANMGDNGQWVNSNHGVLGVNAFDPGIGVSTVQWGLNKSGPSEPPIEWKNIPNESSVPPKSACAGVQCDECYETECPTKVKAAPLSLETGALPEGEDYIDIKAADAAGMSSEETERVKIDNAPPTNLMIRGIPANGQIGESDYPLTVGAADGTDAPSSGVKTLVLLADGAQVGSVHGCAPGPCTSAGKVVLPRLGVGRNTIALVATDNAGNVAVKEVSVYVSHASPVAAGPVSVNPVTGAVSLSATDVSIPSPTGGALTLTRSYDSRQLTAGAEGTVGSQWQLSMNPSEALQVTPSGASLISAGGGITHFTRLESGAWETPKGDENLALSEVKEGTKVKEYVLKDANDASAVHFTQPEGSEAGAPWRPTVAEGRSATDTFTYTYTTEKGSEGTLVKPTEELAPVPAGVSCSPTLNPGCRALQFSYATSTTATGESRGTWGSYKGRLSEVLYVAYDPGTKKMASTPVAAYEYDRWGRLRAEWNPSISPALKTTYGYDDEGYEAADQHLTAVTAPGHQPILLRYGTSMDDPASLVEESNVPASLAAQPGRLLSVTTPGAETAAGDGSPPEVTSSPTLSSASPTIGTTLSVSPGAWKNAPLEYGYQWERCLTTGALCTLIPGAVNQTYTPTAADAGDTLVAVVTALNAIGAERAATTASEPVASSAPASSSTFGKAGSGNGEFTWVGGVALDAAGNVWATDPGNNRIQKFTAEGKWLASYGVEGQGTGSVQFREPTALAISQLSGDIYIADRLNDRIEEIGPKGEYIRVFGKAGTGAGELEQPGGIAIDANGDVWVTDTGNDRLEEFTSEGAFIRTYGSAGTGEGEFSEPTGIAFVEGYPSFEEGTLDVVDRGNDRVDQITLNGFGFHSFGGSGKKKGEFKEPSGIAIAPETGTVFVSDQGNYRVEEFNPYGVYITTFGKKGTKAGDLEAPTGMALTASGEVYVADSNNNRVQIFQPTFSTNNPLPAPPEAGESTTWTIDYGVPTSGAGAPYALGASEVSAWAQKDDAAQGTAVFPPDEPMGWPAKQYTRATITYLDTDGNAVNVASPTGGIATMEYNEQNDLVRSLSPDNRTRALAEGSKSAEAATKLDTRNTYNSEGTQLQSTEDPEHEVKLSSGSQVQARAETSYSYDEGEPSEGGPYNLPTTTKSYAAWSGGPSDVRETTDSYAAEGSAAEGWRLGVPTKVVAQPHGLALAHQFKYDQSGQPTEQRAPSGAKGGNASPTTTITTYYSAGEDTQAPACGEHPEWAGLACETRPAVQPHTANTAELPETETTYNLYDEPEVVTEKFGTGNVRTTKSSYDDAGRLLGVEVTGSTGEALPAITYTYNKEGGQLETQSTSLSGKVKTITSKYNSLGELVSYTDASGTVATYRYNVDGELLEENNGKPDGKGVTTFVYSKTTGMPTELTSTACSQCRFTATWDAEGKELTETFPNGMTATYGYNPTGQEISVVYKKTTDCTEEKERCIWFKDSIVPSIHGQWMTQEGTLSRDSYTYDEAGRLTQVQDTPTGGGCVTRKYAYDEEGNRLSLTTIPANAKGECASSGGIVESHTYDSANRLLDSGVAYNQFGDTTTLPARDAGEAELTSKFFVDNQVASQTQNGLTIGYTLDPANRILETVETGAQTNSVTDHYASPERMVAWTSNVAGEQTQNILGLNGRLVATQNNTEAPVLQVANLHGDIVATAYLSESAEKLASSADTTEYGVPSLASPSKYSWLGAIEMPTELASGVQEMGVRSYVPEVGRFLQPDPRSGGSANAYAYTFDDPVNSSDPTGEYAIGEHGESWTLESTTHEIEQRATQIKEAEEAAARAEAERLRQEAEWAAELAGPQYAEESGEWEWEWEGGWEEEGWEYVSYHQPAPGVEQGAQTGGHGLHQAMNGEEAAGARHAGSRAAVALCMPAATGPCAEPSGMPYRFTRSLCVAGAILAFSCNNGDEHYRVIRETPPVERGGWGRDAESTEERSGGEDVTDEIIEGIVSELL